MKLKHFLLAGIVGEFTGHEGKNCYNTAKISGTAYVGGVVGTLYSSMNNMYNNGKVEGNTSVGGIIGLYDIQSNSEIVENCYCTEDAATDTIGKIERTNGTRKNIEKLSTLPQVLDVINGDNAFKIDSDGKIVLNFDN